MKKNLLLYCSMVVLALPFVSCEKEKDDSTTIGFENLELEDNSYWDGSDLSGGFEVEEAFFKNTFTDWGGGFTSWGGFSYSNMTDTGVTGLNAQFVAHAGSGAKKSSTYVIGYCPDTISFNVASEMDHIYITNSLYTSLSLKNGDAFSKKFGGESGNDQDWFKITITGLDESDNATATVDFYLADYRFESNEEDYIIEDWERVDLSTLGIIMKLAFELSSSDMGDWGMNTPSYFCLDELKVKHLE